MSGAELQCSVCGLRCTYRDFRYWGFAKISEIYQVGYEDICERCGDKANRFVNYYGKKKPDDKEALRLFLVGGALPMRDYSALANAGYY